MHNKDIKKKLTILIPGHDKNIEILNLFLKQLRANWPDCACEIIWSNNQIKSIDYDNVIVYNNGVDSSFSDRLIAGLNLVKTEYVFICLEDFIITNHVNSRTLVDILDTMKRKDIMHSKLIKIKHRKSMRLLEEGNDYIFVLDRNTPYGLCINFSIYNTNFIKSLIQQKGLNGWEVENLLLRYTNLKGNPNVIYCDNDLFGIIHLIQKGRLIRTSYKKLQKLGVIETLDIPIQNRFSSIRSYIFNLFSPIIKGKKRIIVKKILNAIGINTVTKY